MILPNNDFSFALCTSAETFPVSWADCGGFSHAGAARDDDQLARPEAARQKFVEVRVVRGQRELGDGEALGEFVEVEVVFLAAARGHDEQQELPVVKHDARASQRAACGSTLG